MSEELRELEKKFDTILGAYQGHLHSKECVEICNEQVKKALDEVEKSLNHLMKGGDKHYRAVHNNGVKEQSNKTQEVINKLRQDEERRTSREVQYRKT